MAQLDLHARISAPRAIVWEVLTDSDRWAEWADFTHSVRVSPGEEDLDGVGSVREVWTAGLIPTRERVEVFDPDRGRYEYTMLSGPPLKDCRATVTLADDGDGTTVGWTASFRPVLPLPGADAVNAAVFRVILSRLLVALRRESERRVATD